MRNCDLLHVLQELLLNWMRLRIYKYVMVSVRFNELPQDPTLIITFSLFQATGWPR